MRNKYVICELKFGKGPGTDSSEYAANEVQRYHESIKANWQELDKGNSLHHKDGKPFTWKDLAKSTTVLMVAANSSYWAYWYGHWAKAKGLDIKIPSNIIRCSMYIPANHFKEQKGNADTYIPTIEDNHWDIL